ncbi:MAG: hypothetical protein JW849_06375 [Phycisphaerae bacterium]|nr:hypothetical protein [Phycisphaerae bacterium]
MASPWARGIIGIYLHIKYYANEQERQQWAKDFPLDEMPDRETPPYDRDRLLPKHPSGW